jgi:hypothetical protein
VDNLRFEQLALHKFVFIYPSIAIEAWALDGGQTALMDGGILLVSDDRLHVTDRPETLAVHREQQWIP